jgi:colicin import membrane protein
VESFGDKLRAWTLAALIHLIVAAMLFAGLFWTASTAQPTLAGPIIEAELVGLTAAPKPRAAPRPPAPKPPEPKPPEPKPPTPPAPTRNDQIEREKIAEMAQQKAEQEKRAQEEKQHQEQVLLEQQERDHLKQLEEIKRQREAADRKLKLEREKLAQLKDLKNKKPAPETPTVPEATEARTGAAGQANDLAAQYAAAIQNAALNNWLRPESIQNVVCDVHIKQIPGGDLLDAHVVNPCNADPQVRDTIEQAIRRAAPLPYKGYETVFRREIIFTFCYPREVCPK